LEAAPSPLYPAYPADSLYPELAEFGGPPDPLSRPLRPARRKANRGPIVFIALAAGTFIGLAVIAVVAVVLPLKGGRSLLSSAIGPKRERNAVRPITAPAELPLAPVAEPLPAAAAAPEPPYTGPSPEPLLQQLLAAVREINASLAAIHDEATALQHQNEVVANFRKFAALAKQLKTDFPTVPEAELKRLWPIYEPQLKAAGEQGRREAERIGRIPKAGQILARSLQFENLRFELDRRILTPRAPRSPTRNSARSQIASLTAPTSVPPSDPFARYAEREVVEIVVQKLPGNAYGFINDRVRSISRCEAFTSNGSGDSMRLTIAPISDLRSLAAKIDFGTVVVIDEAQSMLVVEADAARLPKP
jgi:hypothetical protein